MAPSQSAALDAAIDTHDLAAEQKGLLDLIDKLQFAQLDNVKLPQIVVVGDQSAGKSSVLEAITGTPFPRDAGACTRFATEIRLRRAAQESLTVNIIPDRSRNYREQERLRQFGGSVGLHMDFETLMRNAADLIAPKNIPGRFAARDILVVEKRGPDMPLLTLVDLPGLVRNPNNDQSIDDIRTIESLSDRYMKSSRTIILAVVGGNSDYAQAPILAKARQFDPSGARTIGVLTKPDLTAGIGLEDRFIDLVQNRDRENVFRLGWFVLLNPGPRDPGQPWPSPRERLMREREFFTGGRWSTLPDSMRGAAALKSKLSIQLQRHIGRHLRVLRRQIQAALEKCEAELRELGEGKDTVEEMRVELATLFEASKELVIPAIYGIYKSPPKKKFFRVTADPRGTPAQNLRARATEENEKFSDRVRAEGRRFNFGSSTDPRSITFVNVQAGPRTASSEAAAKTTFLRNEVEPLLHQTRGTEFPGDAKPRAVYMLFQNYIEYWPRLAQEHKDNLGIVCNEFLGEVIDAAWPARMREPLRVHFLDPAVRKLLDGAQKELEHLDHDLTLEIQPYDPEYAERLKRWRENATKDGGTYSEAEEVLEKMLIHYDLSSKTFIRNIITQVVERHMLQGMYGVFNSTDLMAMSNETVEAIASENRETRDRRISLKAQKKAIEESRDLCINLAMRKELRQYADDDRNHDPVDTSDEEGEPKTPSSKQPATSMASPITPSTRVNDPGTARRTSQQSRDNMRPMTPVDTPISGYTTTAPIRTSNTPVAAPGPAPVSTSTFTPRSPVDVPRPMAWADAPADFYSAPPPQNVPPPPPRPEKLRPETASSSSTYSPSQTADSFRTNGSHDYPYHSAQEVEVAASQRSSGRRKLFGKV